MSSSANQPVCVGSQAGKHLAPHPEEAEPRRGEQVLDRAAGDEVGAERAHVDLDRPRCLVAVGEHERAVRVRHLGDRGHVVAVPRAVRDRRAADERRALVDRLGEALGRDRPVGVGAHVHDLGAAELLGVGDLADRRELVLADHDAVAAAALEGERRDDAVDALRDGRRHRHLVGLAVDQLGEARAGRLGALDPELPLGAVLVPAREVLLVGRAHPVRERALRAGVEIGLVLEDRELAADRGADPGADGSLMPTRTRTSPRCQASGTRPRGSLPG